MKLEDKEFEDYYHRAHHLTNELLSTYNNNLSLEENKEVDTFLKENHLSGELIDRLTSSEIHREYYNRLAQENKEENLALLLAQMRKEKPKQKRFRIWYHIAASVAAIIAIIFWTQSERQVEKYDDWYSQTITEQYTQPTLILENDSSLILADDAQAIVSQDYEIKKSQGNSLKYTVTSQSGTLRYNKLIVPKQYTYTLKLSDQSEVILNAGSILRYPVSFTGDKREVELIGEAFFKVAKSDKPFLVRLGKNNVTVYGTQFNIRSRANSDLGVVLVKGSIGFKAENQEEIRIKPSQIVVCQPETGKTQVKEINPKDYIMWMENMFVFKGQTLERILSEVSIWYGVQIDIQVDVKDMKLTLITNKDNSLEDILKFITKITNIKITKTGDMEYKTE